MKPNCAPVAFEELDRRSLLAALPIVQATTLLSNAAEGTGTIAQIQLTRSDGDPAVKVDVKFKLTGTASRGSDYRLFIGETELKSNTVTMPGGGPESLVITVKPVLDKKVEPQETGTFTILPSPKYTVLGVAEPFVINDNIAPTALSFGALELSTSSTQVSYESLATAINLSDGDGVQPSIVVTKIAKGRLLRNGVALKTGAALKPGDLLSFSPPGDNAGLFSDAFTIVGDDGGAKTAASKITVNLSVEGANTQYLPGQSGRAQAVDPTTNSVVRVVSRAGAFVVQNRAQDGAWSDEGTLPDLEPSDAFSDADRVTPPSSLGGRDSNIALVIDAQGVRHVLCLTPGDDTIGHVFGSGNSWQSEFFATPTTASNPFDFNRLDTFSAAMGPTGNIHFWTDGRHYVLNGGSLFWEDTGIRNPAIEAEGFSLTPDGPTTVRSRYFDLAIDSADHAHIVYTPVFSQPVVPTGQTRPYSELWYATNASGQWVTQIVFAPSDDSGDAGTGASIAINPLTDKPSIASWFVDRAPTGSAISSRLLFHTRSAGGSWATTTLLSSAAGYTAKDGNRGTGFAPQLQFDAQGRAHLAFLDYASQHFFGSQDAFSGNLRYGVRSTAGKWTFVTAVPMTSPLKNSIHLPTMSLLSNGTAVFSFNRFRDTLNSQNFIDARQITVESAQARLV